MKNRVDLLATDSFPRPLPHGCQSLPLFMQHSRRDFSRPLPLHLHCSTPLRPYHSRTCTFPDLALTPHSSQCFQTPRIPCRSKGLSGSRFFAGGCSSLPQSLIPCIASLLGTSPLQIIGLYHCELFKPLKGVTRTDKPGEQLVVEMTSWPLARYLITLILHYGWQGNFTSDGFILLSNESKKPTPQSSAHRKRFPKVHFRK